MACYTQMGMKNINKASIIYDILQPHTRNKAFYILEVETLASFCPNQIFYNLLQKILIRNGIACKVLKFYYSLHRIAKTLENYVVFVYRIVKTMEHLMSLKLQQQTRCFSSSIKKYRNRVEQKPSASSDCGQENGLLEKRTLERSAKRLVSDDDELTSRKIGQLI